MERSRVVYYAKTKTYKVIHPPAYNRQHSAPDDETGHAPLASGEADFPSTPLQQSHLRIRSLSKERRTTNSPSSGFEPNTYFNWDQHERGAKQMVYLDRRDGGHFPQKEMLLRKAPSARKIYPGPVVTAPVSPVSPTRCLPPRSLSIPRSSNTSNAEMARPKCGPKTGTDDVHMTSSITKTAGGYIKQTVLSNIPYSSHDKQDRNISRPELSVSKSSKNTIVTDEVDNVGHFVPSAKDVKSVQNNPVVKNKFQDVPDGNFPQKDQISNKSDDVVIHWTVNEQNAIICRKLSIRSTKSNSENEDDDIREPRKSNSKVNETSPEFSSSVHHDERYNSDKDSGVQSDNTSQNSESQSSETAASPSSPMSKWKRNSLRMATQGFISMSDLTNSVECLQIFSQDKLKSLASPSSDKYLDTIQQSIPSTPTASDVLFSSNGQIYTFFEQLNTSNPKSGAPNSQQNKNELRLSTSGSPTTCPAESTSLDISPNNRNGHTGLIKRNSYALATASNSNINFINSESDINLASQKSRMNSTVDRYRNKPMTGTHNHPLSPRLVREDSISSSPHDSSFGSFYSCQSANFVSAKSSPFLDRVDQNSKPQRIQARRISDQPSIPPHGSDEESESTSMYYTASDTSFPETSISPRSTQDSKSTSPKFVQPNPPMTTRGQKIPITTQHIGLSPRSFKKLKAVVQCYGCGLDKGHSLVMMNRAQKGNPDYSRERTTSSSQRIVTSLPRLHDPKFRTNARIPDSRFRCKSTPTVRLRNFELNLDNDSDLFDDNSLSSPDSDYDWSEMPRSPPALGRPKRKVYAGFDSQPLPMDSFYSDSSSCYTDCGSWSSRATSKSAEVERSYHGSIENLVSAIRSASAEAVDTITPTRQMSQNTLLDFFRISGKQSSVCENNHNVYVNVESYDSDDKLKDSYGAKTFSNESLHSNLSTATTTSFQQRGYANYNSGDYNSLPEDEVPMKTSQQHNSDCYKEGQHYSNNLRRNNELRVDCAPNRNNRQSFDFKFRNSEEFLSNSWGNNNVDGRVQQKPLKASSSATLSRPKYHTKRRYLSSKDIIDLLVNPDRRPQAPGSSSLEKQAQKVCRVILCCNDMEASIHSGQYQF
ncbi:hypothetical protein BgiMline_012516 [Biomphalaria glabrata]|nr:hypothetical protein BgiMline_016397 [Biomphalaria glabrata]